MSGHASQPKSGRNVGVNGSETLAVVWLWSRREVLRRGTAQPAIVAPETRHVTAMGRRGAGTEEVKQAATD